jgi:DNA-binding IclR family transcriptional regulator
LRDARPAGQNRPVLGTLSKAGRVLDLFTVEQPEWGVSEAAETLRVPKSSLHAVFATLASIDLLERVPTGRYRLGWGFVEHSQTLLRTTEYRPHALRAMQRLISRYGETMHLATWSRGRVVCIDRLEAVRGVRAAPADRDARRPPHVSAVGKMLLAHRDPADVEIALRPAALERLTDRTMTTPSAVEDALVAVRDLGVAFDEEEGRPGVCCVAAPVCALDGSVAAAMSLCVPRPRFERMRGEYTDAISAAARDASERLRRGVEEGAGQAASSHR